MTVSNEILARLVRVAGTELGANLTEQDLAGATRLDEVLAIDSMALLKFALGVEHEFGITFDREAFDQKHFMDVKRLTAYLEQRARGISPAADSR
jgi:acyl carrier protein